MSLASEMFRDDRRLQECLLHDRAHLTEGTVGPFVNKVQDALFVIDGLRCVPEERRMQRYGPTTAAAVQSFKKRRRIINRSYQTQADDIVGKMTIDALDKALVEKERQCRPVVRLSGPGVVAVSAAPSDRRRPNGALPLAGTRAALTGGPVASPSNLSPAGVAMLRAPGAAAVVNLVRRRLGAMMQFHAHPTLPLPPGIMPSFDALWACFGLPVFPKNSPLLPGQTNQAVKSIADYLRVLDDVYERAGRHLANANTLFHDPVGPVPDFDGAHAFTLTTPRKAGEPAPSAAFPDGCFFNRRYLAGAQGAVGPRMQTVVALHECVHFVQNDNIADNATQTLSSAHGYSDFAVFCAFGRRALSDSE